MEEKFVTSEKKLSFIAEMVKRCGREEASRRIGIMRNDVIRSGGVNEITNDVLSLLDHIQLDIAEGRTV